MYQNYNYYPQQQSQTQQIPQQQQYYQTPSYLRQAPPQIGLKGRLVTSLEEARATSIDFDGSIFYFPDVANKCIYTKQINMDGTATLNMYELREIPVENPNTTPLLSNYITREEFEDAIAQLKAALAPTKTVTEPPKPQRLEVMSF